MVLIHINSLGVDSITIFHKKNSQRRWTEPLHNLPINARFKSLIYIDFQATAKQIVTGQRSALKLIAVRLLITLIIAIPMLPWEIGFGTISYELASPEVAISVSVAIVCCTFVSEHANLHVKDSLKNTASDSGKKNNLKSFWESKAWIVFCLFSKTWHFPVLYHMHPILNSYWNNNQYFTVK